jgi:hypothetical protein
MNLIKIVEIKIQEAHIKETTQKLAQTPIYKNSHREKAANEVGLLGETIAEHWLINNKVKYTPTYSTRNDITFENRKTLEIKTKDRTVRPKAHYDATIPLYNHEHQQPDYYLFISLQRKNNTNYSLERFHTAYILGASSPRKLRQHGKVWKANETDHSNGTTFWTDCINIPISKLVNPQAAIAYWKNYKA